MSKNANNQQAKAQQPKAQPTQQAPAATPAENSSSSEPKLHPASLDSRRMDWLFVTFYLTFFCASIYGDYHNVLSHYTGVSIANLTSLNLCWPPKEVTEVYIKWGQVIDPLTLENPPFVQAMEWVNILFLTPLSLVGALAFLRGWNRFRTYGLIHAAVLLNFVFILSFVSFTLPINHEFFIGIYAYYAVAPLAILYRLAKELPFTRVKKDKKLVHDITCSRLVNAFVSLVLFAATLSFFFYVYQFLFEHTSMLPECLPNLKTEMSKASKTTCEFVESLHLDEYAALAQEKAVEYSKLACETADPYLKQAVESAAPHLAAAQEAVAPYTALVSEKVAFVSEAVSGYVADLELQKHVECLQPYLKQAGDAFDDLTRTVRNAVAN